ncbi:MAG: TraR/DksA C4-type zinc finger protein [Patescibacteria group bacterium]|nr:TraR/DksA C4-type zinc finger protein [Patescibacteria group bacterium]
MKGLFMINQPPNHSLWPRSTLLNPKKRSAKLNARPCYFTKRELLNFQQLLAEKKRELVEDMNSNLEQLQIQNTKESVSHTERAMDEITQEMMVSLLARENKIFHAILDAEQRLEAVLKFLVVKYNTTSSPPLLKTVLRAARQAGYHGIIYGVCASCGKVIEKERLVIVPHTKQCTCKVRYSG